MDDIDLYAGGVSERSVKGGIVGPTFACIIASTFRNLRLGDRYWYENKQAGFTPGQHSELFINNASIFFLLIACLDWPI